MFRSKTTIIMLCVQNLKDQGKMLLFARSLKYYKIFTIKLLPFIVSYVSGRLCNHYGISEIS